MVRYVSKKGSHIKSVTYRKSEFFSLAPVSDEEGLELAADGDEHELVGARRAFRL
jgi:hypothetical protein